MVKKEFITLRYADAYQTNAYRVRSVPILKKVAICGTEGFAVHRDFTHYNSPKPERGLFRVSHIKTGVGLRSGASIKEAVRHSEEHALEHGGPKGIAKAIKLMTKQLAKQTKLP